jgi:Ca-activated chloride channel family protein
MNTIDKNDPRVTAYALGEPVDADFETQLIEDAALRAEVDAIRATAGLLGATFASEAAVGLTDTQRADVLREATAETADASIVIRPPTTFWTSRRIVGAVASVAAVVVFAWLLQPVTESSQLAATDDGPNFFNAFGMVEERQPSRLEALLSRDAAPAGALAAATAVESDDELAAAAGAAAAPDIALEATALYMNIQATVPPAGPSALTGELSRTGSRAAEFPTQAAPAAALPAERELPLMPDRPEAGGLGNDVPQSAPPEWLSEDRRWRRPLSPYPPNSSAESYAPITDNPFTAVAAEPLSTFSVDVDTASYANMRRFLTDGQLPPPDAVRIEELLNYFRYNYPQPRGDDPFAADIAVANAPWAPEHRLVRVGLKGREVPASARPASNLVFLVDVSGSMDEPNKLPLVQTALRGLVSQLDGRDKVAIVVYAGNSGLVLAPTAGSDSWTILGAIDRLDAGGSTNGGEGIQLAYELARRNFIRGGTNRVILATDGDFNVGITDQDSLVRLIEEEARSGVFLSVLGFGTGNLKDSTMELLADKGNGNYAYIDGVAEARKVLGEQVAGTLMTIAKDVKAQLEFNPALVSAYRLIGYENRVLAAEDFNNDAKDAGDIGSGHTVTALYEVVPTGVAIGAPGTDPLRYQQPATTSPGVNNGELLTLKLRYKAPDGQTSKLLSFPVRDSKNAIDRAGGDFQFAAAVAAFGMLLRNSPYSGSASYDMVSELANRGATQVDDSNERASRAEFLQLVDRARQLSGRE